MRRCFNEEKKEREILKKAAAFFGVSFLAYLRKNQREISLYRFREEGVLPLFTLQSHEC